jgi:hypothetical protein
MSEYSNKLVFCISIPCVRSDCARDLQIGLTDGMGRDIRHAYNDLQSRPGKVECRQDNGDSKVKSIWRLVSPRQMRTLGWRYADSCGRSMRTGGSYRFRLITGRKFSIGSTRMRSSLPRESGAILPHNLVVKEPTL